MKKSLRIKFGVLSILVTLTLLAGAFLPADGVHANQEGVADPSRWELVLDLAPEAAEVVRAAPNSVLTPFKTAGLEAALEGNRLSLKGQGNLDQLRTALFDNNAPGMDFLGGAVELYIHMSAGKDPVTLNLETRIASGYTWEVLPVSGAGYAQIIGSNMAPRYRAYGAPSIQTIQLKSSGSGAALAHLVYRRSFEKTEASHARLDLYLVEVPASIDIIDPTPQVMAARNALSEESIAEDPIADIPQVKDLPASWDWRTQGIVPAVRDQGGCGSCWAFGTVGVMESAVKKAGGPLKDLSEQFLVSCNTSGWSCAGGLTAHEWHFDTLAINQTRIGAVLETDKPYIATNGSCTVTYNHPYKLSGWQFITGSEWTIPTVAQIKNAIYTYGPVTAGICALGGFASYSGGVFEGNDNCGGYTNHQIILTGWDDTTGSWILRNSWGPWWGENGYMRIKYDTPASPHSRVGEGTSWVKYTRPEMTAISPAVTTTDRTPTFKWTNLVEAGQYHFQVYQGTKLIYERWPDSTSCGTTTCQRTPAVQLSYATYQWRVRAKVGGTWAAWSAYQPFSVVPISFISRFSGTTDDWMRKAGGTWQASSMALYTTGLPNKWTSAFRPDTLYSSFDYSARVKRTSALESGNFLAVNMGKSVDTTAGSIWYPGYLFGYSNSGYYSIWELTSDGNVRAVQPWTKTTAIIADDWNTLRVLANQGDFKFYINGVQLRVFNDTTRTSGYVGMQMFQVGSAATKFQIDWARLSGLSSTIPADSISAEQHVAQ